VIDDDKTKHMEVLLGVVLLQVLREENDTDDRTGSHSS